ncbi:MAG: flagellar basal body P-ring protein FlgI [Planctomycetota bacterium]|nr:flagellar basal body P-ring protein FlgI [Planctomycetota bacterium]
MIMRQTIPNAITIRRVLMLLVCVAFLSEVRTAQAITRISNVCTIDGQMPLTVRGLGFVVGLNGTGDPDETGPTARAFAAFLKLSNNPLLDPKELTNLGSVAAVEITATIPRTGISRGQQLDCQVSVLFGAKSLEGGSLITSPVELAGVADDTVVGLASGRLIVDDLVNPTTARIPFGLVMEQTVDMNILRRPDQIRLLLNRQYAGVEMAREVERAINQRFYLEASNVNIARATSPVAVDVTIPAQYDNHIEFLGLLTEITLKETATAARVVVNASQGTIIVTGDVEISPAIIAHKNLNVEIADPFVELHKRDGDQVPQQLADLVNGLNQLKVPTNDIIGILRELHFSGRLHAEFIER